MWEWEAMDFKVHRPKLEEIQLAFSEPKLAERLLLVDSSSEIKEEDISTLYCISIEEGKYKIYLSLAPYKEIDSEGIYELHIAIPKDSIVCGKLLSMATLHYALNVHAKDVIGIYTNANYRSMANLAINLGFKVIKVEGDFYHLLYVK